MTQSPQTKRKLKSIFGTLVIILSICVIMFGGPVTINKPIVEGLVKDFTERLASDARMHGDDATSSFSDISIEGLLNKRAIIKNFVVTYKNNDTFAQRTMELTTDTVVVTADPSHMGAYRMEFPNPLNYKENGNPHSIIQFAQAPVYTIANKQDAAASSVHNLQLPPQFTITEVKPVEGEKGEVTTVSYDPNPTIIISQQHAPMGSNIQINFGNVKITSGQPGELLVGNVSLNTSEKTKEEGVKDFDTVLTIADISMKDPAKEIGPITFKLSMNGTAHLPATTGELNAAQPVDMDITLRELLLSADKFKLSASGQLSRKPDDSLPFGTANVVVENLAALRAAAFLNDDTKNIITNTLNSIIGEDTAAQDNLNFAVQREKLGTFYVGKATFEQLAGDVFKAVMMNAAKQQGDGTAPSAGIQNPAELNDQQPIVMPDLPPAAQPAPAPVAPPAVAPVPAPAQ